MPHASLLDILDGRVREARGQRKDPHVHTRDSCLTREGREAITDPWIGKVNGATPVKTEHDYLRKGGTAAELSTRFGDVLVYHPDLWRLLTEALKPPQVDEINPETLKAAEADAVVDREGNLAMTWYWKIDKGTGKGENAGRVADVLVGILENGGEVVLAHPFWNSNVYSKFEGDGSMMSLAVKGFIRFHDFLSAAFRKLGNEALANKIDDSKRTAIIEPLREYGKWDFRPLLEEIDRMAGESGKIYRIGLEWNMSNPFYHNLFAARVIRHLNSLFKNLEFYLSAGTDSHVPDYIGVMGMAGGIPYFTIPETGRIGRYWRMVRGWMTYTNMKRLGFRVPDRPTKEYLHALGSLYLETGRGEEIARQIAEINTHHLPRPLRKLACAGIVMLYAPFLHMYYHVLNKQSRSVFTKVLESYSSN